MTGQTSVRRRYESLFFIGIAIVVVLLPFPNVFGIFLDGMVLAIANPILGNRVTLALLFVYNFNPIKLNGVIGIYYVIYAIFYSVILQTTGIVNSALVSATVILALIVLTLGEYLLIRDVSAALWSRFGKRMPEF